MNGNQNQTTFQIPPYAEEVTSPLTTYSIPQTPDFIPQIIRKLKQPEYEQKIKDIYKKVRFLYNSERLDYSDLQPNIVKELKIQNSKNTGLLQEDLKNTYKTDKQFFEFFEETAPDLFYWYLRYSLPKYDIPNISEASTKIIWANNMSKDPEAFSKLNDLQKSQVKYYADPELENLYKKYKTYEQTNPDLIDYERAVQKYKGAVENAFWNNRRTEIDKIKQYIQDKGAFNYIARETLRGIKFGIEWGLTFTGLGGLLKLPTLIKLSSAIASAHTTEKLLEGENVINSVGEGLGEGLNTFIFGSRGKVFGRVPWAARKVLEKGTKASREVLKKAMKEAGGWIGAEMAFRAVQPGATLEDVFKEQAETIRRLIPSAPVKEFEYSPTERILGKKVHPFVSFLGDTILFALAHKALRVADKSVVKPLVEKKLLPQELRLGLGIKEIKPTQELKRLKVTDIISDPKIQPRGKLFDEYRVDYLVKNFDESKFDPIVVTKIKGKYYVLSGFNRLEAVKRLGKGDVLVIDKPFKSVEAAKEYASFANAASMPLKPSEQARVILEMTGKGKKVEEIADYMGIKPSKVEEMRVIGKLSQGLQEQVDVGNFDLPRASILGKYVDKYNLPPEVQQDIFYNLIAKSKIGALGLESFLEKTIPKVREHIQTGLFDMKAYTQTISEMYNSVTGRLKIFESIYDDISKNEKIFDKIDKAIKEGKISVEKDVYDEFVRIRQEAINNLNGIKEKVKGDINAMVNAFGEKAPENITDVFKDEKRVMDIVNKVLDEKKIIQEELIKMPEKKIEKAELPEPEEPLIEKVPLITDKQKAISMLDKISVKSLKSAKTYLETISKIDKGLYEEIIKEYPKERVKLNYADDIVKKSTEAYKKVDITDKLRELKDLDEMSVNAINDYERMKIDYEFIEKMVSEDSAKGISDYKMSAELERMKKLMKEKEKDLYQIYERKLYGSDKIADDIELRAEGIADGTYVIKHFRERTGVLGYIKEAAYSFRDYINDFYTAVEIKRAYEKAEAEGKEFTRADKLKAHRAGLKLAKDKYKEFLRVTKLKEGSVEDKLLFEYLEKYEKLDELKDVIATEPTKTKMIITSAFSYLKDNYEIMWKVAEDYKLNAEAGKIQKYAPHSFPDSKIARDYFDYEYNLLAEEIKIAEKEELQRKAIASELYDPKQFNEAINDFNKKIEKVSYKEEIIRLKEAGKETIGTKKRLEEELRLTERLNTLLEKEKVRRLSEAEREELRMLKEADREKIGRLGRLGVEEKRITKELEETYLLTEKLKAKATKDIKNLSDEIDKKKVDLERLKERQKLEDTPELRDKIRNFDLDIKVLERELKKKELEKARMVESDAAFDAKLKHTADKIRQRNEAQLLKEQERMRKEDELIRQGFERDVEVKLKPTQPPKREQIPQYDIPSTEEILSNITNTKDPLPWAAAYPKVQLELLGNSIFYDIIHNRKKQYEFDLNAIYDFINGEIGRKVPDKRLREIEQYYNILLIARDEALALEHFARMSDDAKRVIRTFERVEKDILTRNDIIGNEFETFGEYYENILRRAPETSVDRAFSMYIRKGLNYIHIRPAIRSIFKALKKGEFSESAKKSYKDWLYDFYFRETNPYKEFERLGHKYIFASLLNAPPTLVRNVVGATVNNILVNREYAIPGMILSLMYLTGRMTMKGAQKALQKVGIKMDYPELLKRMDDVFYNSGITKIEYFENMKIYRSLFAKKTTGEQVSYLIDNVLDTPLLPFGISEQIGRYSSAFASMLKNRHLKGKELYKRIYEDVDKTNFIPETHNNPNYRRNWWGRLLGLMTTYPLRTSLEYFYQPIREGVKYTKAKEFKNAGKKFLKPLGWAGLSYGTMWAVEELFGVTWEYTAGVKSLWPHKPDELMISFVASDLITNVIKYFDAIANPDKYSAYEHDRIQRRVKYLFPGGSFYKTLMRSREIAKEGKIKDDFGKVLFEFSDDVEKDKMALYYFLFGFPKEFSDQIEKQYEMDRYKNRVMNEMIDIKTEIFKGDRQKAGLIIKDILSKYPEMEEYIWKEVLSIEKHYEKEKIIHDLPSVAKVYRTLSLPAKLQYLKDKREIQTEEVKKMVDALIELELVRSKRDLSYDDDIFYYQHLKETLLKMKYE